MALYSRILSVLSIAAALPAVAHASAPQPEAGYYRALIYITGATPDCKVLGEQKGAENSAVFYYPGPSAKGANLRFLDPINNVLSIEYFPQTPAAGVTSWRGVSKQGNEPAGPYTDIPFHVDINLLDAQSFSVTATLIVPLGSTSKCYVKENIVFAKTGS